jgi:hypothetical protein
MSAPSPAARPRGVTVDEALRRAQLCVNGPVLVLLIVGLLGLGAVVMALRPWQVSPIVLVPAVLLAVVPAWIWWSLAIPKWRLWAMKNVEDWPRLKAAAIEGLLLWPDGSFFERTEIKSSAHAEEERRLEAAWQRKDRRT